MNLKQAFKMAIKSIVSKKMRSFLTMLGIIIGVAAVVIMVSALQGQNKKTMEYIESQGTNRLDVYAYSYSGKDVFQELYDYCLGMSDLVQGVTPNGQIYNEVVIRFGAKTISTQNWDNWEDRVTIYLGSDQYGLCNNYTIAQGRELSHLDVEEELNVCVLGGRVAETLFDFVDPVGQTITLNGTPFTVVGVYERKDVDGWPEMDNIILLPYTFNRTMNNNQTFDSYSVKAVSSSAASQATVWLNAFLQGLIGENGYYNVQNSNVSIESSNEMLLMQSLIMGSIAGISLLVGGIGIMNIMLVTVTERTREIGIRKAIGAERRSIIVQFLIEASMLCGIGGILGIFIGYLGTLIVGKLLLNMILYPSMLITVGAFVFSVALGIGFGLYPAIKASGLQPVNALRAE